MATRVIENRRDRLATILVAPLMSCSARLPVYILLIGAFLTDGLRLVGAGPDACSACTASAWSSRRWWPCC